MIAYGSGGRFLCKPAAAGDDPADSCTGERNSTQLAGSASDSMGVVRVRVRFRILLRFLERTGVIALDSVKTDSTRSEAPCGRAPNASRVGVASRCAWRFGDLMRGNTGGNNDIAGGFWGGSVRDGVEDGFA